MSTLPACRSSGGAMDTQTRSSGPGGKSWVGANRTPPRVTATSTWSAVPTANNQNTQVTAVASRSTVASRCSRPRGLGGLRVAADIGRLAYRLSLLSRIVSNENRYVKDGGTWEAPGGAGEAPPPFGRKKNSGYGRSAGEVAAEEGED